MASGGRGVIPDFGDSCSHSGIHRAATAADRREIALLDIKRDLGGDTTDVDLLNQIQSFREAFAAQQTQLLDLFDPPSADSTISD